MPQHRHSPFAVLDVLTNTSFRYLWFAQICSQLALNMMIFILALSVYERTGSNAAVSGLFLSYGIPSLLFGMIAGVIVDHVDRSSVLIVCDFSRAVLVALLFFFVHNILMVYIFVFVHALINQLYVPSEAPMIPRIVPKSQLLTANSVFSFTYYSSMAVGFILAGPLLRLLSLQSTLCVLGLSFLAASFFASRLPRNGEGFRSLHRILHADFRSIFSRFTSDVREGIAYIYSSPVLSDALTLLAGTQVIIAILGTLGPGLAHEVLKIDIRDASVYIIGPTVVGIISGALWVGNVGYRISKSSLIRAGIVGAGIILILISISVRLVHTAVLPEFFRHSTVLTIELVLFFLLGVANSLLDVPANSILQSEAQGSMRGRVYGMLAAVVGGMGMLPVIAGGVLADVMGVGKVILLLGVVVLAYGAYRIRYNKRIMV